MLVIVVRYEKERAAEAPLNQNSHGTDAVVLSEFPEAKRRSPNGREDANTMVSAHNTAAETTNGATTQCNATANFDGKPRLSAEGEADARRPASSADIGAVTLKEVRGRRANLVASLFGRFVFYFPSCCTCRASVLRPRRCALASSRALNSFGAPEGTKMEAILQWG